MKKKLCLRNFVQLLLALSMVFALSACGGGGDSPFSDNNGGGGGGITASAGPNQNVTTNSTVTLDASGSIDSRGGQLHYFWHFVEKPEGSQVALSNPSVVRPTFTPDKDGVYLIILVVTNGQSESAECVITVTAASGNSAPVANPGGNQNVTTGSPVTLDGSASSDADGNTITYSWSFVLRPFGSQATLSNPSAAKPSFTPDMDGEYVLVLIVFDGTIFSAPVTVTITASAINSVPIANPGIDQNVAIGNLVTLDGSQSSGSGSATLSYSWSFVSKPASSNAELSSLTAVKPTFMPDVAGDYVISLIVHDGNESSDPVTITVTIFSTNSPPAANPGSNQNVATGTFVTLDGSASSDADGDNLTFSWSLVSKPEGSNAQLSNPSAVRATFLPDLDGDYVFRLVVYDGTTESTPTTVTVTAATANSVPVANAGSNQNIATGAVVTLDGSASSDADGDLLSFTWSFVSKPDSSQATLFDANAVKPTFIPDVDGDYVVRLVVHDGSAESTAVTITITAATQNSAPIAHAGADQNVTTGTLVTLDGSASSDADGDLLSFTWSFVSKPDGSQATLSDTSAATPTFTPDVDGDYVARLVVNDGEFSSSADTVIITAATANSAPVAQAGADQNVVTGTLVTLDGSASSDADGDVLSYSWAFVSKPEGSQAILSDNTAVKPTFTPDIYGDYVFRLVVNDGAVSSAADVVTITCIAPGAFKWLFGSGFIVNTPTVDSEGKIFVPANPIFGGDNVLYAMDFQGNMLWSLSIPWTPISEVALTKDDNLVVGLGNGNLVKIDKNGNIIWTTTLEGALKKPEVGDNGTIYVGSNNSIFFSVDNHGTPLWQYNAGHAITSMATVSDDGNIYFWAGSKLISLRSNGEENWVFNVNRTFQNKPIIDNEGNVYVVTETSTFVNKSGVYKLNSDGEIVWSFHPAGLFHGDVAMDDAGTIYVSTSTSALYAINSDGTLKWTYPVGTSPSTPVVHNSRIYLVLRHYKKIHAIDQDGEVCWISDLRGALAGHPPAIAEDDTIYVPTGSLEAFQGP